MPLIKQVAFQDHDIFIDQNYSATIFFLNRNIKNEN